MDVPRRKININMRGNRSLEAKERFPRAPSEKADWVNSGNKNSASFSANKYKSRSFLPYLPRKPFGEGWEKAGEAFFEGQRMSPPSAASIGAPVRCRSRRLFRLTHGSSCGLKAAPAAGRPAVSLPSESCVGWAKADGLLASPPAFSYLLPAYIVNGEASGFPDVLSSSTGFLGRVFFGGPRTPSRIFILLYIPGRLRPPEFSR